MQPQQQQRVAEVFAVLNRRSTVVFLRSAIVDLSYLYECDNSPNGFWADSPGIGSQSTRSKSTLLQPKGVLGILEEKGHISLNPVLRFVVCSQDEVLIRHGSRSKFITTLQDDSRSGALGALIEALRNPSDVEAIIAAVPESAKAEVPSIIEDLLADGLLVRTNTSNASSYASAAWGMSGAYPAITVLGAGDLATRISEELTRIEIDTSASLTRERGNELEEKLSNTPHAIVASDALQIDWFLEVDAVAREVGTKWLPVLLDGPHGYIGPWIRPLEGPCMREVVTQLESTTSRHAEYLAARDYQDSGAGSLFSPAVAAVTGWAVSSALAFIANKPSLIDRMALFDFERLGMDTIEMMRLPRCPACSSQPPKHTFQ